MARPPRIDVGGCCYHVLNRANARYRMFRTDEDFAAFERVLAQALVRHEGRVQLLAYCLMGNHWHLVLRTAPSPGGDGELGRFMKWLTTTHAGRYRVAHGQEGIGHLYQGRYKSFLIGDEKHFLGVCRYVERNAARASLPTPGSRAEDWAWGSLWRWRHPAEAAARDLVVNEGDANRSAKGQEAALLLSPWPLPQGMAAVSDGSNRPRSWLRTVNTPINTAELEAMRVCVQRGRPYGSPAWVERTVKKFGLESTMRGVGRPRRAD